MFCPQSLFVRASIFVCLLFASLARSQSDYFCPIIVPGENEQNIKAGSVFKIVWEATPEYGSKVTLSLLSGSDEMNMEDGPVLASGLNINQKKFAWLIPTNLEQQPTYGLRLALDSNPSTFQYSYPFSISFVKDSPAPAQSPAATVTKTVASPAPAPKTTIKTTLQTVTTGVPVPVVIPGTTVSASAPPAKAVTVVQSFVQSVTIGGSVSIKVIESIRTITGTASRAFGPGNIISTTLPGGTVININNAAAETQTQGGQAGAQPSAISPGTNTVTNTVLNIKTSTPSSTSNSTGGTMSTGGKVGISIAAIIIAILLFLLAFFLTKRHYRKQQRARAFERITDPPVVGVGAGKRSSEDPNIEMGVVPILTDDEMKELLNRRRAAELSGVDVVRLAEKEGEERDELEARRREAKKVHEIG